MYHVIGSLNDRTHKCSYASTPFFLTGVEPRVGNVISGDINWAGVYYSGCASWVNSNVPFGSQYYYYYYYFL